MNSPRVEFQPDKGLYPFQSRWFNNTAGICIHYIDEGAGRPILLLHGNPTWSFLYRKIIPKLREFGFRCIAPDYPGFGLSSHPEKYGYTPAEHAGIVLALIQQLNLRDLLIMGQDWGGPIGLSVATQAPERVGGLILGNTFGWAQTSLSMRLFANMMRSRLAQRYIIEKNGFIPNVMTMVSRKLTEAELNHYTAVVPAPDFRRGMAELAKQIKNSSLWLADLERQIIDRLAGKPALLIPGHKDRVMGRPAVVHRLQKMFPDNTVVELANAGHFIQEDAPMEVAAAIRARFIS